MQRIFAAVAGRDCTAIARCSCGRELPYDHSVRLQLSARLVSTLNEKQALLSAQKDAVVRCCGCEDEYSPADTYKAPCTHSYCDQCLQVLFRNSMQDPACYPPRCCRQRIELDTARARLGEVAVTFEAKREELEDPRAVYCHVSTCSAYIGIVHRYHNNLAHCPSCKAITCIVCKGPYHVGNCPEDPETEAVLERAAEEGWQQCRNCSAVVELDTGCNHMT